MFKRNYVIFFWSTEEPMELTLVMIKEATTLHVINNFITFVTSGLDENYQKTFLLESMHNSFIKKWSLSKREINRKFPL